MGTHTPLVHRERAELVSLMRSVGPDHSTLCTGWTVRDLAAHILMRERRPDAAIGIALPVVSRYTEQVMKKYSTQTWDALLAQLESGPPFWSPFARDIIASKANMFELLVHHEDVRRAQENWTERSFNDADLATLWSLLKISAPLLWRRAHVGVTLIPETSSPVSLSTIVAHKTKSGADHIVVTGSPVELILASFGRQQIHVSITGSDNAEELFAEINRTV